MCSLDEKHCQRSSLTRFMVQFVLSSVTITVTDFRIQGRKKKKWEMSSLLCRDYNLSVWGFHLSCFTPLLSPLSGFLTSLIGRIPSSFQRSLPPRPAHPSLLLLYYGARSLLWSRAAITRQRRNRCVQRRRNGTPHKEKVSSTFIYYRFSMKKRTFEVHCIGHTALTPHLFTSSARLTCCNI